jgi:hypothetical protein
MRHKKPGGLQLIDAVDRLLAVQEEIEPPIAAASAEEVYQACIELLCNHGVSMHRNILTFY